MPASHYLARLLGPVLAALGLSRLCNPRGSIAMAADMMTDTALRYVASVIGLTGGIARVLAHNVSVGGWRLIIILLGWISVIGALTWRLLPGAGLCFFGYRASQPFGRTI
jgi:hypothetical protein